MSHLALIIIIYLNQTGRDIQGLGDDDMSQALPCLRVVHRQPINLEDRLGPRHLKGYVLVPIRSLALVTCIQ